MVQVVLICVLIFSIGFSLLSIDVIIFISFCVSIFENDICGSIGHILGHDRADYGMIGNDRTHYGTLGNDRAHVRSR